MEAREFLDDFKKEDGYSFYFCPGRVNLIGEHIDYNGGRVMPYALDYGIYGAGKKLDRGELLLRSANMDLVYRGNLDDLSYREADGWANYPKGIIREFLDRGYELDGLELNFFGNIPEGAGLSSSAAIEVLTCQVLDHLNNLNTKKIHWALLSQKVENEYIGVNCGIMDQFAVAMARENKAILLDCDSLDYEYIDVNIEGADFIIVNSNKKRALAESKYNERRQECQEILEVLREEFSISELCQLPIEDLDRALLRLDQDRLRRRLKHVVTENHRVNRASEILKKGDKKEFGRLLLDSHMSLKLDYEVTGRELDSLVEEGMKIQGVLGARMTGAGFGGSTIFLVEDWVEDFEEKLKPAYFERTGLNCQVYKSGLAKGVSVLK